MLKKTTITALYFLFLFCIISNVIYAAESSDSYSIFRISIWPEELSWPKQSYITGVSLGLPSSYGLPAVYGADLSLIWGDSQDVYGFKLAPVNTGSRVRGVQLAVINQSDNINGGELGVINLANESAGIQLGIFNKTDESKGAQFGIVNFAENSDEGIQIGVINIMENGFLPVFPVFNYQKND